MASRPKSKRVPPPSPTDVKEALIQVMCGLDAARVKRLLDSPAGAALTKRDLGRLLFHSNPNATPAKQVAVMRLVLARGADPNVKDEDDEPLVAQIAHRMAPAVLRLYKKGIGVQLVASADAIPRSQQLAIEVGGTPNWHQEGTWPGCEKCGLRMFFIVQIGGSVRLYVFLCERCRVTSTIRQID